MSYSLRPHGLQHTRLPCPSPTPGAYSNSCPSMMPSYHLILSCPLLLPPSIFPRIRVFSNESVLHMRWPKSWSFSFSISPSNEYSGLISCRMDWLDLLAVQGTLKSLFQHHSLKASIIWCSAFFIVQLSHPYMTTGKTIALTRWTFVGKVLSLLFSMLSGLVIAFLPRSKRLLISWLWSPSAVILEPPKIKSVTVSTVSLSICHEVIGPDAMILVFWMFSFNKRHETIMNNYMAIKWITWKKWKILRKVQSSKVEPGRNRNYEQCNYKHWIWSCDQNAPQKQKPRTRWLHRRILSNI